MKKINVACVVDDDEIYTFSVKRIIAKADIADKTIFFHNGKAALDFIIENMNNNGELPDLILLDLNMPVLDGWQFLDEFAAVLPGLNKKITVYIVSSSIDQDDYRKAKQIELVTDFVVKPLTVDHLHDILTMLHA
ncbi:response regulator [Mucilaginibacter achroorhodeus]|uniref:Response regulator n=1 Tax=Mucilaginibacter achroorhodeus TaxID=2599294 RepID=A0A563TYR6_9SPHI|nr:MULTISPECIES: response regulator [Mucilaginibacter]QXV65383.1 response regulator [Mucilaginibacter sp. 21P]TWR24508.1 response regulator [Mucilaginibacter achroorhodeus]